ncbi:hypothetical protein [Cyclobacterium sediminis]
MKPLIQFSLLLLLFTTWGCNGPMGISTEELDNFESKLTAGEFFWQSRYGSYIDFQFQPEGTVYALINGKPDSRLRGNWSFDSSSGELQIAWEGGRQYASVIKKIENDWGKITFTSKIHEYGDKTLTRLKLLDDRFNSKE